MTAHLGLHADDHGVEDGRRHSPPRTNRVLRISSDKWASMRHYSPARRFGKSCLWIYSGAAMTKPTILVDSNLLHKAVWYV